MLIKASSIIGLKVVSLRQGEDLGKVYDVVYDPEKRMVRAILIDEKGWGPDSRVILIKEIQNIGRDAITVSSAKVVKKASEVPDPVAGVSPTTAQLKKMNLVSEKGTNLGRIADLSFDSNTGNVEETEISQGAINDLRYGRRKLAAKDIVKVGKDNIIVSAETEDKFREQMEKASPTETIKETSGDIGKGIQSTYQKYWPGAKGEEKPTEEKKGRGKKQTKGK